MCNYKIYVLNDQGHITFSYDFEGANDLSALEESRKYSDRSAIEIWDRARQVARIDQGAKSQSAGVHP